MTETNTDTTRIETETAVFGAGCFWGVEARFAAIDGVIETEVGYAGGTTENPTYEQVCSKKSGHAEVVRVRYDASRVPFADLMTAFWDMHNPTQRDRQGADIGSQYRSVIFATSDAQLREARAAAAALQDSGAYRGAPKPIVTLIDPEPAFWRAEDYHQRYLAKRGRAACGI